MRKILLSAFVFLISLGATAQKRLVLIEEFTNDGCGPCANYSPTLDAFLDDRLGDVIAIKYHGEYPDRNDPIYLAQKEALDKKISLYSVSAYPTTVINGTVVGNQMSTYQLNYALDVFGYDATGYSLTADYSTANNVFTANAHLTSDSDRVNNNLKLFAAVIEEKIKYTSALPNGETELNYTCRQLLPDGDGQTVGPEVKADSVYDYSYDWTISNVDNGSELGLVVFLQDMSTKKVLATVYVPKKPASNLSVSLKSVFDTPDMLCTPDFYGKAVFRNMGSDSLTSATLNVEVNGVVKTYPWTGKVGYLQNDTIDFGDFTDFQLSTQGNNNVRVWLSNLNGTDNQSNESNFTFSNSIEAKGSVQLVIYTDRKPEETTWKVYSSAGEVVAEGGPYDQSRHIYRENLQLTADDCYTWEILDAGGDGIKGNYGNGYYQLYQVDGNGKRTRLTQGDFDNSVCDINFKLTGAVTEGIDQVVAGQSDDARVAVYDEAGRKLGHTTVGAVRQGALKGMGQGVRVLYVGGKASKVVVD